MYYVTITSALLAPITAIFLAWLAYKDYQTKTEQLKLDLYDRRYKIYKAIEILLRNIMINGRPDSKSISEFVADTNEREFLFDKDVTKFIDKIRDKAIHMKLLECRLSDINLPIGEKRNELAKENTNLSVWFGDQLNVSKNLFTKYLKFKK